MDWWQLLYSFIGGFLGFGFAILTEALINHKQSKNDRAKLKNNLIDELKGIANALKGHESDLVAISFDTPIWQSIISTGILLSLLKDDKSLYDEIMLIYNHIYSLRIMERNIEKNQKLIEQLRKTITDSITELLNTVSIQENK